MPSMKSRLATIAPAIDALTSSNMPMRSAVSAMTSSVRLPRLAFRRPPMLSPVLAATDSVALLRRGQRNDGSDRKDEKQGVRLRRGMLRNDHRWREDEKPQDRLVSQLLQDSFHPECSFTCAR